MAAQIGRRRACRAESSMLPPPPFPMPAGESIDLLLNADGRVESASMNALEWLEHPGVRDVCREWVRMLESGHALGPESHCISIRHSRLSGQSGTRYFLHLEAHRPKRSLPLTNAQREVALLAASGATLPEVASLVGRSVETVRTHMREIYRRLSVSSRAELVRVLDDAGTKTLRPPPPG